MNTLDDLRSDFADLEALAPSDDAMRAALRRRVDRRARRRRTGSLVAVAAAVVLVAGGAGITRAVLADRSPQPAGPTPPSPVVAVPDVPLPADTQLVRHELEPVTSPVTATPPDGLTGTMWISIPDRLAVTYFSTNQRASSATAGYVITDSERDSLVTFGGAGPTSPGVSRSTVTVGGHRATLTTAPPGAADALGLPASERLTWQLANGKWIHVWAGDRADGASAGESSSPSAALTEFATSIVDRPAALYRTVGIGLTLPGLTNDSSLNTSSLTSAFVTGSVAFCPAGVNPYAIQWGSSSGSGSGSGSEMSASIEPGAGPTSVGDPGAGPQSSCLVAYAIASLQGEALPERGDEVTVAGTTVHVDAEQSVATAPLRDGLTAVVSAPPSAHLSTADLAALAASVRVSPAVSVAAPQQSSVPLGSAEYGPAGTASASAGSVSAVAPSASSSSADASAPGTAPADVAPGRLSVSGDHTIGTAADPASRTGTLTVWLSNTSTQPLTITAIGVDTDRLDQTGVRLDVAALRTASDPPTIGDDIDPTHPLPLKIAPGTEVPFQVEFAVASCVPVSNGHPGLVVEYEFPHGGASSTLSLVPGATVGSPSAADTDWVSDLTEPVCG